jgi:hypothetical protein
VNSSGAFWFGGNKLADGSEMDISFVLRMLTWYVMRIFSPPSTENRIYLPKTDRLDCHLLMGYIIQIISLSTPKKNFKMFCKTTADGPIEGWRISATSGCSAYSIARDLALFTDGYQSTKVSDIFLNMSLFV